jgi:hypothetical protein
LSHRPSVECPTFRTLLLTLYSNDANTPPQDRGQLGVAEFVNGAVIVDRRVPGALGRVRDRRRGFGFVSGAVLWFSISCAV